MELGFYVAGIYCAVFNSEREFQLLLELAVDEFTAIFYT